MKQRIAMVLDKQLILIIFKLINFGVLIGLGYVLWRKYARSYLMAEFNKKYAYQDGLQQTHTRLQQEKKHIAKIYQGDQQEREQLKERLSSWRDALEHERISREQYKREQQELLKKRVAEQLAAIEQHHLLNQLYKEAMGDARIKLEKHFSDKNAQKEFMTTMFKRLS
jgi:hypothetical protein